MKRSQKIMNDKSTRSLEKWNPLIGVVPSPASAFRNLLLVANGIWVEGKPYYSRKIVVQTLQYNWDTKTMLARTKERQRRKEDGVSIQEINWVVLNNSKLEILHRSLARPYKNGVFPIHLALFVFFLAWQKEDGGGMVYFMFCTMDCVHLVSCVTKYSLVQVRWVKETLLRGTPNPNQLQTSLSCYGPGGLPTSLSSPAVLSGLAFSLRLLI